MTKVLEEFKMELVMDVALEGVVDKEVTKQVEVYKELVMELVVEEVNRELLKEFNEGLVLVCRCGDGLRGDHKVDGGLVVVLDKKADMEVIQMID